MHSIKIPTSDSYQEYLIDSLQDAAEAAAYIEAILEVTDPEQELLLSALKDIIEARSKTNSLSPAAQMNWAKLHSILEKSGGSEIYSLVRLLEALGWQMTITAKS